ncbi:hypothetical protein V3589_02690 [Sinorhizobium fredii]|uniref:hypothetical protein n=2 Tax=Rhizobium fredii TaxID=380 RepID=UPI000BACA7B3|nr:hypothetical protein [Sinorhizobium fredii]ASY68870.1 hypothetical protein SF83666_c14490 [Sinorhizobium fredii CCBAU 83666]
MRTILEQDLIALKGATEASFVLGGGLTSFQHFTRVGVANLSKYASKNDEQFIPIDVAIEADKRHGSPVIIAEAARQLGFKLEPLADADRVEPHELTDADGVTLSLETADVVRAIHEAHGKAHGRLSELSRKRISRELHELKRAVDNAIAAMARVA